MTIAEGGGRRALAKKFQDVYIPSLKANYILWPAVQIINFRLMPLQFQIVSQCLKETSVAQWRLMLILLAFRFYGGYRVDGIFVFNECLR